MPHLVVLYTKNLDTEVDMSSLCRRLADAMLAIRDRADKPAFPPGGVCVLAYPAAHSAVADGRRDYAFVHLNLRMGRGRAPEVKKEVGDELLAVSRSHFASLFANRYVGLTLQIDEGQEVFDAKYSTIQPLFEGP